MHCHCRPSGRMSLQLPPAMELFTGVGPQPWPLLGCTLLVPHSVTRLLLLTLRSTRMCKLFWRTIAVLSQYYEGHSSVTVLCCTDVCVCTTHVGGSALMQQCTIVALHAVYSSITACSVPSTHHRLSLSALTWNLYLLCTSSID